MWADMKEEVELQLAMLREHMDSIADLRRKVATASPNMVETMAIGAFLHAFYNGIENAFKRIAIHMDAGPPRGEAWHQELLASMIRESASHDAVISRDLRSALKPYLDFRHVFRNIYPSWLDWEQMGPLVSESEKTLHWLERELTAFLEACGDRGSSKG